MEWSVILTSVPFEFSLSRLNSPAARFHEHVALEDVKNLLLLRHDEGDAGGGPRPSKRRRLSSSTNSTEASATQTKGSPAVPEDVIKLILAYWRIKRRAEFNTPLVHKPPAQWTADLNKTKELEVDEVS